MRHQKQKHCVRPGTKVWKTTRKPKAQRACLPVPHTWWLGRPLFQAHAAQTTRGKGPCCGLDSLPSGCPAGCGYSQPPHTEEGSGVAAGVLREKESPARGAWGYPQGSQADLEVLCGESGKASRRRGQERVLHVEGVPGAEWAWVQESKWQRQGLVSLACPAPILRKGSGTRGGKMDGVSRV